MIESFLSTTFAYDAFQRAVSQTDGSRVKFTAAPRIGIAYASKRDQNRKWRFTIKHEISCRFGT